MAHFIEITLTTGAKFHVDTDGHNAAPAVERFARRSKREWVETVEGAWVNPDQIVSATIVDLASAPTGRED